MRWQNPSDGRLKMALADLHVHSKYSKDGDEWFLKKIGAQESYTEIEDIYAMAKMRKMHFVTITDHNSIEGSLELVRKFPKDTFTGVELTCSFPEDGCKIHFLVYDIRREQFDFLDSVRNDIYKVRDYIRREKLAYSVAHATFSMNRKLDMEKLEKLILLFDVFEGTNGARNVAHNRVWTKSLDLLVPEDIDALYEKYKIEPFGNDSWIKGFTGGSDDHGGLFIGKTFTAADCTTRDEFIQCLKDKKTFSAGRSNNFKSMAFTFYKIGNDFSQNTPSGKPDRLSSFIHNVIIKGKRPGAKAGLIARIMRRSRNEKSRLAGRLFSNLCAEFRRVDNLSLDQKIDRVYQCLTLFYDDLLKTLISAIEESFKSGNAVKLVQNLSGMFSAALLSAPFFTTLRLLNHNRNLIDQLKDRFFTDNTFEEKCVLWFSDAVQSVQDLPAARCRIEKIKRRTGGRHHLAFSLPENLSAIQNGASECASNPLINFPPLHSFSSSLFPAFPTIRIPSILASIATIHQFNPDEIIVDTPGPMGLLGLIASVLFDIKCIGIFHPDSTVGSDNFVDDPALSGIVKSYVKWFFSCMDETLPPQGKNVLSFPYHEPSRFEVPFPVN